jgi:hypothetical protein
MHYRKYLDTPRLFYTHKKRFTQKTIIIRMKKTYSREFGYLEDERLSSSP